MWNNKPFKPPAFKGVLKQSPNDRIVIRCSVSPEPEPEPAPPPAKKRRLIHVVSDDEEPQKHVLLTLSAPAHRKPLLSVNNAVLAANSQSKSDSPENYYNVLWRKFTVKKHKTWDGDGVLCVRNGYAYLQDVSGKDMGKCVFKDALLPGSTLSVGGKDVEVDSVIAREDFLSGRPFLKSMPKRTSSFLDEEVQKSLPKTTSQHSKSVAPKSFYTAPKNSIATLGRFKTPILGSTVMPQSIDNKPTPRHNPLESGALVMTRPRDCPKGKQTVDVVVDPFLTKWIRDHQREGVKFMYECVMGMREFNGNGAILADAMGLGKTFMTIALIWTLLKQNPIHGAEPVIKKVMIVCPVTLIANWKAEFRKWLGKERIGVFVLEGKDDRITDFTHGKSYNVMIVGYEKLRNIQEELKKGSGIDLIVCDEGHRLKTAENKSAQAIKSLNTNRRIILSGTPLQNDLSELFVMVDFVNPGTLGTAKAFKKEFEMPIMRNREPDCIAKDKEKGDAREAELSRLIKQFVLRREADVLQKYLPPKTEYVVFCKPTDIQAKVYQHVLASPVFGNVLGATDSSLQLITILKKVCNSPSLLTRKNKDAPTKNSNVAQLLECIPQGLLRSSYLMASSKMQVLDSMLRHLSKETNEKIVLVSNYTSTLDILQQHLTGLSLPYLRLDGQTPANKRMGLVNEFNKTPNTKSFAFLLSAKSGGAGINLIGASRLVLFDVDWNPATDLQAMARIHRDGQKRPVKIYRFLMAGGMDEKIYQRQISKIGLADSVMDGKKNEASFSPAELRDLFRLQIQAGCQTHELLGCDCEGHGIVVAESSTAESPTPIDDSEISDSDDEFPENPAFDLIPASQWNAAQAERKLLEEKKRKREKKSKMQALMQYSHIDTSIFDGEIKDVFDEDKEEIVMAKKALDDPILVQVLEGKRCHINFVFVKKG